jgi:hypothetical protein
MRTALAILTVSFWIIGLGSCALASTTNTTITGSVLILTGTACFVGLCIVNSLDNLKNKLPPPPPPR